MQTLYHHGMKDKQNSNYQLMLTTSLQLIVPILFLLTDRIATFDNDGNLWSEQPAYFQLFFAIDRVKALAPEHPEWKTTQPLSSCS